MRYETDEKCPRPSPDEERRSISRTGIVVVLLVVTLTVISALLAKYAQAALASVYWRVDLNQGTSVIAYGQGATEQAAWDDCFRLQGTTRAMTAAETRKLAVAAVTSPTIRWCKNPIRYATVTPDQVTPPPTSSPGTISWHAPTTNDDGSPLTDLAWYLVTYGTTPEAQIKSVRIPATTRSYQLPVGTWYCSVRSVNATDTIGVASATVKVVRL